MTLQKARNPSLDSAPRKLSASRRLGRAFMALLTILWIGLGLFLLVAGAVNIHLQSVLAGATLLGGALVFHPWIIAVWR